MQCNGWHQQQDKTFWLSYHVWTSDKIFSTLECTQVFFQQIFELDALPMDVWNHFVVRCLQRKHQHGVLQLWMIVQERARHRWWEEWSSSISSLVSLSFQVILLLRPCLLDSSQKRGTSSWKAGCKYQPVTSNQSTNFSNKFADDLVEASWEHMTWNQTFILIYTVMIVIRYFHLKVKFILGTRSYIVFWSLSQ